MEKVTYYLVNIDFEKALNRSSFEFPTWNKLDGELEYLFFWLNEENQALFTKKSYSADYLKYIEELTGTSKSYSATPDRYELWWGQLNNEDDFDLEKKINSNLILPKIRDELGLDANLGQVFTKENDLQKYLAGINQEVVIKDEFGFSGQGLKFTVDKVSKYPVLVERWVERVRDFGVYVDHNQVNITQSHIGPKGTFKGSLIKNEFPENEVIKKEVKRIFDYCHSHYKVDFLQIDMYQFMSGSTLQFQFLGEINHRRTLGTVGFKLHEKFGNKVSFLGIIPSHKIIKNESPKELISSFDKLAYNPVTKTGVIMLSSGLENFSLFLFTEESERTLQFLIRDWWIKLVGSDKRLPPEFIVYL
ncbi:MAG: hypothetical protein K9K67_04775 [Bacteriovoracaceae bacterium]|nr:hypothetical protein [Bacteriovoracaceae bacterium]